MNLLLTKNHSMIIILIKYITNVIRMGKGVHRQFGDVFSKLACLMPCFFLISSIRFHKAERNGVDYDVT